MFWKHNANSSQEIGALLGKEDVTLLEVMDSDDIINECRVQNKALIDFLQKPNILEELVILTTNEPPIELEDHVRYKYPNIACELLTCDVPALNERLASDELLLEKLYNFLDREPPLNPLLASFFSKIMGALIAKKTEQNWLSYRFTCLQVLDFLKAKDTFISLLLKHIGTSAIMDLMLKLFTQVEGIETKQNILNWLDSQQIIQSLVCMFNPSIDKDRHYNVAQLLCDFLRIARENQKNSLERADPDPLLNTLESSEIVDLLLETILDKDKCESSIVGGIQVLLALLDVNQTSISKFNSLTSYSDINDEANDVQHKQQVLNNITTVLLGRVADFHNILLDPPKKMPLELTFGVLDPPLGQTRLQVLKLFVSVISLKNDELLLKMMSLGTFSTILDLFFKYSWNNFLHTQVEKCLVLALKHYVTEDSDDTAVALCKHFIENCKLIERILEAWEENDKQQEAKGVRQGYMGHLINIMNEIINCCSKSYLGHFLKENHPEILTRLEAFKDTTLAEINKTQKILLGGFHPNGSNNQDSGDFGDSNLSNSIDSQQQMFAEYQMQYLSSRYIEGYYSGFNDDAFNEAGGNPLQSLDPEIPIDMNFSDNNTFSFQAFKQLCSQSINTLDDADDQIFEDKDNTFQTVIEKQEDQKEDKLDSSDSDDDITTEDDMDPWSTVKAKVDEVETPKDPWNTSADEKQSEFDNPDSWADFSSISADMLDCNADGISKPASSSNLPESTNDFDERLFNVVNGLFDVGVNSNKFNKSDITDGGIQQATDGEVAACQQEAEINIGELTLNEPSKNVSPVINTLDKECHDSPKSNE
ncbi:serine/threonine-protein phosphatase 6 regulatory subunit 3 isoform X2 [Coccinella septempunctata]|uniref:serine/threonine-protein phosphatase 6 regulatory subunit 3 isoform X2 n=1 Tax=Coccinella septempunctata TaxID=41139 RepID=UPI001D065245|nr:serine/threonine-protein phosphatase 6 regulatory subunit 3 isoform X2 [Coccinella septempunctata]